MDSVTMEDMIYLVRKHGDAEVETKEEATQVVLAAADQGYTFEAFIFGFGGWKIVDRDA